MVGSNNTRRTIDKINLVSKPTGLTLRYSWSRTTDLLKLGAHGHTIYCTCLEAFQHTFFWRPRTPIPTRVLCLCFFWATAPLGVTRYKKNWGRQAGSKTENTLVAVGKTKNCTHHSTRKHQKLFACNVETDRGRQHLSTLSSSSGSRSSS